MYLTTLMVLACAFPDALPDALPDAAAPVVQATGDWLSGNDGNQYLRDQWGGWWRYETATERIDAIGRDEPKAMAKKPEPAKKAGHFETRRSCGPNGCVQTQVWVPDAEPAVPLPVPPEVKETPAEQPQATQQSGGWTTYGLFGRKTKWQSQ
jgi:hypothetical protein